MDIVHALLAGFAIALLARSAAQLVIAVVEREPRPWRATYLWRCLTDFAVFAREARLRLRGAGRGRR
jgi:hypothetical protein